VRSQVDLPYWPAFLGVTTGLAYLCDAQAGHALIGALLMPQLGCALLAHSQTPQIHACVLACDGQHNTLQGSRHSACLYSTKMRLNSCVCVSMFNKRDKGSFCMLCSTKMRLNNCVCVSMFYKKDKASHLRTAMRPCFASSIRKRGVPAMQARHRMIYFFLSFSLQCWETDVHNTLNLCACPS